jgi:hypothetical protein
MLSRVTVCGVTGDECEKGHWKKLNEADHPKIESAARQRIHMPTHRNHGHLSGQLRAGPRPEIEQKRAVAEKFHPAGICN